MTEIDWTRISREQFEDIVGCLLCHLNPDVRRMDGAGGDGGTDAEFRREDGLEIFQMKKFNGRLTPNRRRQVKESLRKAAERSPVAWTLIVPIDHTPAEWQWFKALQDEYDFPLSWRGKTWLAGQLAERPSILRYFLDGENDRVVELLRELKHEEASVTSLQVGMDRVRALAQRINEIDPHYRFDVSVSEGAVQVVVTPRYRGAELDRPSLVPDHRSYLTVDTGGRVAT